MNLYSLLKYTGLTTLGLIGYFLLMRALGLATVPEWRVLNFAIVFIGVASVHRYLFIKHGPFSYLQGWLTGIRMSALSVIAFMLFMTFYGTALDPAFMDEVMLNSAWGGQLSGLQVGIATTFEGLASCVMISFISMQYFKVYAKDMSTIER